MRRIELPTFENVDTGRHRVETIVKKKLNDKDVCAEKKVEHWSLLGRRIVESQRGK